ncbi:MAG: hypothetical protein ACFCVG_18240 [Kineosporiaceae bacterium]
MTTKERLHALVDQLGDEEADRALAAIEAALTRDVGVPAQSGRRRRPRSLGFGSSGRHDVSENVDAILAEGFGRSRPAS